MGPCVKIKNKISLGTKLDAKDRSSISSAEKKVTDIQGSNWCISGIRVSIRFAAKAV